MPEEKLVDFKINRSPHPDVRHLSSRIHWMGTIVVYNDDRITIKTKKPQEVIDYVKDYLVDHHVTFTYRTV